MSEDKPKQEESKEKPRYGEKPPQKDDKKQQGGRPQRGPPLSPAQQRRRAAEERISNWTPKTELGRKVVAGEITTVEEALATGLPLREPPIVDLLIPDMFEEVIDIHMVQECLILAEEFDLR